MQNILTQPQIDITPKPCSLISKMLSNSKQQEMIYKGKFKSANISKKFTRRDILKLVKEDTNNVFYLDEEFILSNEEILLKIIANSTINLEQKRAMLRHLDIICSKTEQSMLY